MSIASGDAAFDEAYGPLFRRAATLAYRLLGERAAAEDVAAEALARAYARWSRLEGLAYRDAWVLRVATNLAIDAARRRPRGLPIPNFGDRADAAVLRIALVAALRSLPRRQRQAVALRYLSGLPHDQVATALGISAGSASTHLRRGLAALRLRLGEGFREDVLADERT
jgi:RNA polymerase sigma factor (sigma-70 family)